MSFLKTASAFGKACHCHEECAAKWMAQDCLRNPGQGICPSDENDTKFEQIRVNKICISLAL